MVVEYLKITHDGSAIMASVGPQLTEIGPDAGDVKEMRLIGTTFCCSKMRFAWALGKVGFGYRSDEIYLNKVAEVYIRCDAPAHWTNIVHGKSRQDLPIPYCPWCRSPITTFEVTS